MFVEIINCSLSDPNEISALNFIHLASKRIKLKDSDSGSIKY